VNSDARPPRSLFITQDYPPRIGGAQSYYWGVIQTLDPDDLVIIAPHYPDAAAFDAAHPYRVIRTERSIMLPDRGLLRLALQTIQAHDLELVQFGHCLPLGLLGPALRRRGHPYLVFILGAEVTLPAVLPVSGQAIRAVMRDASLMVAVSRYTAVQAQRLVAGRVPTAVLDPAIDTHEFRPPGDAEARRAAKVALGVDGELVVCLGRLVPRKGQDRLIDAVALLQRTRPGLHLALIGGGRLENRLRRQSARLGLAHRVHHLGAIPLADVQAWLRAADVFASPCRDQWGGYEVEGFGLVFAEASLCGAPVLAGRSGGAPEAVRVAETGIVVDGRTAAEVAQGLERLLRLSTDERGRMGARGRRAALERHAPEVVGRRYRALLTQALRNARGA
jgi:phosphatidyl-myo-inositol dimannoside synthase